MYNINIVWIHLLSCNWLIWSYVVWFYQNHNILIKNLKHYQRKHLQSKKEINVVVNKNKTLQCLDCSEKEQAMVNIIIWRLVGSAVRIPFACSKIPNLGSEIHNFTIFLGEKPDQYSLEETLHHCSRRVYKGKGL